MDALMVLIRATSHQHRAHGRLLLLPPSDERAGSLNALTLKRSYRLEQLKLLRKEEQEHNNLNTEPTPRQELKPRRRKSKSARDHTLLSLLILLTNNLHLNQAHLHRDS